MAKRDRVLKIWKVGCFRLHMYKVHWTSSVGIRWTCLHFSRFRLPSVRRADTACALDNHYNDTSRHHSAHSIHWPATKSDKPPRHEAQDFYPVSLISLQRRKKLMFSSAPRFRMLRARTEFVFQRSLARRTMLRDCRSLRLVSRICWSVCATIDQYHDHWFTHSSAG
jgi:hypothetical protein